MLSARFDTDPRPGSGRQSQTLARRQACAKAECAGPIQSASANE
jgi:hypothetical protein